MTQAVDWLTKAAEQGDARAPSMLGDMYESGNGVPQSYLKAYIWFSIAVAQLNETQPGYEVSLKNRDTAAKKLTPGQLSKARNLAAEFQTKNDNQKK